MTNGISTALTGVAFGGVGGAGGGKGGPSQHSLPNAAPAAQ